MLDIDETSLSNYAGMTSAGFKAAGAVGPTVLGTATGIDATLDLYRFARAHGVAVFFITGRPSSLAGITSGNLKSAGYDKGWDGVSFKPGDKTTVDFKSGARADIQKKGYDLVLNVGDQESDLNSGHADRAFKYPNPFYCISDN